VEVWEADGSSMVDWATFSPESSMESLSGEQAGIKAIMIRMMK
jgi:hypothetical protein